MQPAHFSLEKAIRPHIHALRRFSSPDTDTPSAQLSIHLDLNENSAGSCLSPSSLSNFPALADLHRYPSASHLSLKKLIAQWRNLSGVEQICLGLGAANIIDLLVRATCAPGKHGVLIAPPMFELYGVCPRWHDVGVVRVDQVYSDERGFGVDVDGICSTLEENPQIRLLLLASPGNPTSTLIPLSDTERLLNFSAFTGILALDEAYIDFTQDPSRATVLNLLPKYANLVVVQSLSKSHGLSGIRFGIAIAHPSLTVQYLKIQPPYAIPRPTLALASKALAPAAQHLAEQHRLEICSARQDLVSQLRSSLFTTAGINLLTPTPDANFVLVRVESRSRSGEGEDGEEKGLNARATWLEGQLREGYGIMCGAWATRRSARGVFESQSVRRMRTKLYLRRWGRH